MTTIELRKAVKRVDPQARVSQVDDDHWTIRTREEDTVARMLPSLGLAEIRFLRDTEGSQWDWTTVLHVSAKKARQLDAEIAQAMRKERR